MSDQFTDELWQGISGIYGAILAHPFVTGLTDGSLPAGAFAFYVVQDALYLQRYAEALAAVASRAPGQRADRDVRPARRGHHHRGAGPARQPAARAGPGPRRHRRRRAGPTTLAYTSYLLAAVRGGSYAEGVGAVLPCYWIYWEVGKELLRRGSPDPRYQKWIDTYAGDEFAAEVREVIEATDALAADLSPAERARVHRHFRATSRYEWMFWDMGYRQETWPV